MSADTYHVKNKRTGEKRTVTLQYEELEEAIFDGACRCSGPCECNVEPDGECPEGWPSILVAAALI